MVRRTKQDAEITRNQLLDAAENVFNEKGVARTSLAEIASAAGVTRGAIYWHFKNKADLFHAMLERVKMPIDQMIDQPGVIEAEHLGHRERREDLRPGPICLAQEQAEPQGGRVGAHPPMMEDGLRLGSAPS